MDGEAFSADRFPGPATIRLSYEKPTTQDQKCHEFLRVMIGDLFYPLADVIIGQQSRGILPDLSKL
jgi:hypothetical protein